MILGRPWLETADSFIGCRSGSMLISHGTERKKITLYPSAQIPSALDKLSWINDTKEHEEEVIQPFLSINQFFDFQEENNEDLLDYFIAEPDISEELRDMQYAITDQVLGQNFQENCTVHSLALALNDIFNVHSIIDVQSKTIEISPGKHLNISAHLTTSQEE